ncbi:MAG TPA: hypothetical protein VJN94_15395 [Candidatus Binataceae bacterium]|nr:hypothetical protein [Candidatus Binataceae bacterium]
MRFSGEVLIAALVFGLIATCSASADSIHIMRRGSANPAASQSAENAARAGSASRRRTRPVTDVSYHGGALLPAPHIYAIYWGNPSRFPEDYTKGMNKFLATYGNTGYTDILTQYLFGPTAVPTFNPGTDSWQDTSTPFNRAGGGLKVIRKVGNEVCKFIKLTSGPDPNGAYLVMTSNFPRDINYCAWHSFWSCPETPATAFTMAYLPDLNHVRGCYIGPTAQIPGVTNPYSDGVHSDANAAGHELSEIITDPLLRGWYDHGSSEIADKCLGHFVFPVSLSDGLTWQLQELWSNDDQRCIQSAP